MNISLHLGGSFSMAILTSPITSASIIRHWWLDSLSGIEGCWASCFCVCRRWARKFRQSCLMMVYRYDLICGRLCLSSQFFHNFRKASCTISSATWCSFTYLIAKKYSRLYNSSNKDFIAVSLSLLGNRIVKICSLSVCKAWLYGENNYQGSKLFNCQSGHSELAIILSLNNGEQHMPWYFIFDIKRFVRRLFQCENYKIQHFISNVISPFPATNLNRTFSACKNFNTRTMVTPLTKSGKKNAYCLTA